MLGSSGHGRWTGGALWWRAPLPLYIVDRENPHGQCNEFSTFCILFSFLSCLHVSLPSSWRGDGALTAWDPRDSLVCLLFLRFRFPSPRFSSPFFNFYLIVVLLFFLESKYLRTPHVVLAPSIISVFWTHSCHRYLGVPRLRADQPSLPRGYSAFQYNPLCGDPSV